MSLTYAQTTQLDEALARSSGTFLAGGTNLVDLMKLGVAQPQELVDVTKLPGLDQIEDTPDGLRIGATVRNADLAQATRERFPLVSQALLAGASGQLRNMATTGGNLLQRTRCVYFTDITKACNKRRPGSGCDAREGEHHNLAILGHSEQCVATHPSDMAVAMLACDAQVHVTSSARGDRTIPLDTFHRLPEDAPQRDTVLEPDELITAVTLPDLPQGSRSTYRKARERASYAFALGSVAASVLMAPDGTIADVRIAWGAVAHKPWRAHHAETALRGRRPTERMFREAADAELQHARPLRDNAFKVPLLRNLTIDVLQELTA